MIEARELRKTYGTFEAVKGISFKVSEGDVVGLLGPNGAGKTTTMRMLTTFLPPSGGTALIAGFDIRTQSDRVRRNIGYLPEHPPLYPEMRVEEYLTYVARIKGLTARDISARVRDVIERCALGSVRRKLCSQLSRGFRQRVGLAQAVIHRPKVIILDEPTSGLDPTQIIEIRRFIAELRNQHTVVLSTHILSEVMETCNRVIIIAGGKLVIEGDLQELTRDMSLEQRFIEAVANDASYTPREPNDSRAQVEG